VPPISNLKETWFLDYHDLNAGVRWRAADALGKIGDARALPELERIAREDTGETWSGYSVAEAAREAIARIRQRKT